MTLLKHAALAAAALSCCASPALAEPTTLIDAPTLAVIGQYLVVGLGMLVAAFVRSHVKNQATADALDRVLMNAVSWGFNMVPGALKGKALTVDMGSQVASHALKYALDIGAKEAGHFQLEAPDLAKRLLARIPGIDGQVSASIVHDVVAAAHGAPPALDPGATLQALAPSAAAIAEQLMPQLAAMLERSVLAHNGAAAIASQDRQATG